jgi:surface-anchored protein
MDLNVHAHANWAFTAPGIYRLGVEVSGASPSGERFSDSRILSIAVGNVDPTSAFSAATIVSVESSGGDPAPAAPNDNPGGNSSTGIVVGAVTVGLALVAGLVVMARRRRRVVA